MNLTIAESITLKGQYKLMKKSASGELLAETDWIPNLITNAGLNSAFAASGIRIENLTDYCAVGSGNTAPSFSDTQLVAQLGSRTNTTTSANHGISGSPEYYGYAIRTFQFPLSGVIGNVAELGLFSDGTGTNAFTRSLVKDGEGNPTTFPVLDGEQLFVTYELREYRNLADTTGSIVLEGNTYDYTIRSINVNTTNSLLTLTATAECAVYANQGTLLAHEADTIPPITGGISGTSTAGTSFTLGPYTADTFERAVSVTWGPAIANYTTGIGSIGVRTRNNGTYRYGIFFSPKIPKTNTKSLSLTVKTAITRI